MVVEISSSMCFVALVELISIVFAFSVLGACRVTVDSLTSEFSIS